jgi:cell division septation protein DedD/nucleoid DNA-binding protein
MISVAEYLKKLLYEQDCVVVPELGGFLSHFNHAYFSGINGLYYAPAKRIAFNEALKLDDGLLVHYISVNEQIKREEAQIRVRQFTDEVKSEINKWGSYQIPELGILMSNQEGKFVFDPQTGKNYYQEGYGLKTISVNTVTPQVSVQERQLELELTDRAAIEQPVKATRRRSRVALYSSSILLAGGLFYAASDTPLSSSFRSLNPLDLFLNNSDEQKAKEIKITTIQKPAYQAPARIEPIAPPAKPEVIATPVVAKSKPVIAIAEVIESPQKPIIDSTSQAELPKITELPQVRVDKKQVESDDNAQYFIIAGAFLKEENAQKLVEKLKKSGYSNASMMTIDERNLFKVSAVGLSSQTRAVGQMARINKLSKAQSWIFYVD